MTTFETAGHVGDHLCLISAAHTYAKLTGKPTFVNGPLPDVIAMYTDGLLQSGTDGDVHIVSVGNRHRRKHESPDVNYLGTFLADMLPEHPLPMPWDLPPVEMGTRRYLIQPRSVAAPNPPIDRLQRFVDGFNAMTGETLYAVGHSTTSRELTGVDYSYLEDSVPMLIRHIASAKMFIGPRSAGAHIAAAYGVPAIIWNCPDGEGWHLDYGGPTARFDFGQTFHIGLSLPGKQPAIK